MLPRLADRGVGMSDPISPGLAGFVTSSVDRMRPARALKPGMGLKSPHDDRRVTPSFPSLSCVMQPDLSPEDCAAIAALLRDTIAADRFPMSPRIKRMRAILNKLDPPVPKPAPFPPLKPPGQPSMLMAKKQAWRR